MKKPKTSKRQSDDFTLTVPAAPAEPTPDEMQQQDEDKADALHEFNLFGVEAGDMKLIPSEIRGRAVTFLESFADGAGWGEALKTAGLKPVHIWIARKKSQSYAAAFDGARQMREWARTARVEDSMFRAATGTVPESRDFRPPDARAAALVLGGWDSRRYGKSAGQAESTQVVLNVQL